MLELMRKMKITAEAMQCHAATIEDPEGRKAFVKWARASQNRTRLLAAIDLAKSESEIATSLGDLDKDRMILNLRNGVVDLSTGALRPHSREDLLTRMCEASFDKSAECPLFLAFLERIFSGDRELIAFVQRALGYGLTGDTSEQCLFLLYGRGANGKSVLLNTVRIILSSYAKQAQSETFTAKRTGGTASGDLARLVGVRFVTASELDDGAQAAEALLKQISGGDTITARYLYQEDFEYDPAFKLFIATNHRPQLTASDDAIWRRIHQIPFAVVIPPEERDRHLGAKLLAERDGILNWLIEGAVDWANGGLRVPDSVRQATAEYRREVDAVGMFLDECCEREPVARATSNLLYVAYQRWCVDEGADPVKADQFGRELTKRGFGRDKIGGVAWRVGVRLRQLDVPRAEAA